MDKKTQYLNFIHIRENWAWALGFDNFWAQLIILPIYIIYKISNKNPTHSHIHDCLAFSHVPCSFHIQHLLVVVQESGNILFTLFFVCLFLSFFLERSVQDSYLYHFLQKIQFKPASSQESDNLGVVDFTFSNLFSGSMIINQVWKSQFLGQESKTKFHFEFVAFF